MAMKAWRNLGVVDTIYEEKEYDFSSASPSLSPTMSLARRQKTDILICVHGRYFHLHKDALTSRSSYLKREFEMTEISELSLSPPLNITAETFSLVADFCYGTHIVITPFNVAALRTAAELLEMTELNGEGEENLLQITENYFRRIITVNREYASIVFRSCLSLLPEAETTAYLVSRCVEALSSVDDGDGKVACFDDVIAMAPEDFQIVAESMHRRLTSHDVLYRTVDLYFKAYSGKITEEQKTHICSSIDCNSLSPQLLLEAVQNPTMPLRFIVRAMLMEQLNTRRSIFTVPVESSQPRRQQCKDPVTLGAILQREAALHQSAHLKAAMDATSSRIQSLEKELNVMKKLLDESEKQQRSIMVSARSASFHNCSLENKIERGDIGSASSGSFRFYARGEKLEGGSSSLGLEGSCTNETPRITKNIRQRLMKGLKSAFRVSKSPSKNGVESKKSSQMEQNRVGDEDDNVIDIINKENLLSH
ncbi:btb/poz domain-containing protein [Quercus suber]|uniref:Btb/poz domain-containing protein n=1 Tax=Quercus suber TaxID=58331 RepID=A0AAW0LR88_QUESU